MSDHTPTPEPTPTDPLQPPAEASLESFKRRSPWGWWLLSILTLGIGFIVWHYQINRDLAEANTRRHVSPGMAAVAITIGALLILPPFVTVYNTADRIQRTQRDFGQRPSVSGGLSVLLYILLGANFIYQQYALNRLVALREGEL